MAQLFRCREIPPKIDRVRNALAKLDLQIEQHQIITHHSKASLIHARVEAEEGNGSGKISLALIKMLYRCSPFPGAFCSLTTGQFHIQENTGTVMVLHEATHSADSANIRIRELIDEVDRLEALTTFKRPLASLRYKIAKFRLLSLIEGRAKFCEQLAGDNEKDFTFFERLKFKISCNFEAILALTLGSMSVGLITIFIQRPIAANSIDLVLGLFSAWACSNLFPYVLGKNLLDAVNEKFDSKETLRLTAENPPKNGDFFRPHKYAKSLAEIQN
ncbi:MAG: hypothetical protein ABID61_03300 [Candidatus Micrarchaeota archaeon]